MRSFTPAFATRYPCEDVTPANSVYAGLLFVTVGSSPGYLMINFHLDLLIIYI